VRATANKLTAFSLNHKLANNMVNLAATQHQHYQNLTNLLTPHFEKLAQARGRKSTGSECVLLKELAF
jgi:flagellar motor switch protein FliG